MFLTLYLIIIKILIHYIYIDHVDIFFSMLRKHCERLVEVNNKTSSTHLSHSLIDEIARYTPVNVNINAHWSPLYIIYY